MRITLAAVGRLKRGPERELVDSYLARLPWAVLEKEVVERRSLPAEQLREREGERLLAALSPDAVVVVLDPGGRELTSPQFAERLSGWRDTGVDVAFAIGGADGLSEAVRSRADLRLSFGAQTWPHMLARVMLAEQLYRAAAILSGHPYHR
ncbi:23S rRNA (pseudouridine1915-N3)-methyltransferase [Limimonas halophila]|uniref:Ribosomal RNA large subunit methyltransferase H n=1 Tax=Limimonas halophila TaxID=1082479 RepID=A0A1G7TIK7_9PROT|nr:23S rRNA (pseudouridine(1915)-N(3))-methyltransferase RlmH [Limimonas halophila]SDG35041.1 23S rRNA (pseudouridine1915-N3)-methyltransferase [Limimonas halophila]